MTVMQFAILRAASQARDRLRRKPLTERKARECLRLIQLGNDVADRLDRLQIDSPDAPASSPSHANVHSRQLPGLDPDQQKRRRQA